MNNLTLNCFFKDKNEKIPKVQSPTHELMIQLKEVEKKKAIGDSKFNLLCALNSIIFLYSMQTNELNELNYLLNCSYKILFQNHCELRTYDKNIYSKYGLHSKYDIAKTISKNWDQKLLKHFCFFMIICITTSISSF